MEIHGHCDPRFAGVKDAFTRGFEVEDDRFVDLYDISSAGELENCYVVINRFYAKFDQQNPYANVPRFVATYPVGIPATWKTKEFWQSAVIDVP